MPELQTSRPYRPRLVGQPLLYAISVFASLGVFLVSVVILPSRRLLTPGSLGTTKGMLFLPFRYHLASFVASVMSGIITGPHFRQYFNYPGPLELGTMVAVLEVGAFSTLTVRANTCSV